MFPVIDQTYHAKLSDFGLARMGPTASKSHVSTQVMGTYGYAAPEYVATGHLYVKSDDVYGFGMVLVEMLTGLRALDTNRSAKQHNLVDWIKPSLQERRKLKSVMDSHLEGRYPSRVALKIAQLALNCVESEQKNRPSMQEIVETLEEIEMAREPPRQPRVHSSYRADDRSMPQQQQQQQQRYHHQNQPMQEAKRAYPLPPRT
ncbi:putative serine/threonine-protein kinase pix13 [Salvia divinorum]|uniref:Serine/threonine-protein kinase pix13 n=1 Tax=Salvia divinorum TaxID=28513 RepID=A0ABD1IDQ9_SALDI